MFLNFKYIKRTNRVAYLSIFFAFILTAILLLSVFQVAAQAPGVINGTDAVGGATGLGNEDPRIIIARIIRIFFGFVGAIFVSLMIYAGFLYMTSGGDESKTTKAKKTIINATIGLVIMMSAFAITSFIISRLQAIIGGGTGGGSQSEYTSPGLSSGILGRVIQDHYPAIASTVPRNTVIMVTFKEPIVPSSVIAANGNFICQDAAGGDCSDVKPDSDCLCTGDLDTESIKIYEACESIYPEGVVTPQSYDPAQRGNKSVCNEWRGDEPAAPFDFVPGEVYITPDFKTIVVNPYGNSTTEHLGGIAEDVTYFSLLTNNIRKYQTNTGVFTGQQSPKYPWYFTTNTVIDTTPPFVTGVYPVTLDSSGQPVEFEVGAANAETHWRNSRIRVDFSEAVIPPIFLKMISTNSGDYGNAEFLVTNDADGSVIMGDVVAGINQYRSLIFKANGNCGTGADLFNSCGDIVTCLPANSKIKTLVRSVPKSNLVNYDAANPNGPAGPTSVRFPVGGIVDSALNGLDTNGRIGRGNGQTETQAIDSFDWTFLTSAQLDLIPPNITAVTPANAADKSDGVRPDSVVSATYSEAIDPATTTNSNMIIVSDMWSGWYTGSLFCDPGTSPDGSKFCLTNDRKVMINHGPFSLAKNPLDVPFFFPKITSGVQDMQGNCFNPCKGPACDPLVPGRACCGTVDDAGVGGMQVQTGAMCPY
ncbi:hypothetical protein COT97_02090 [Candidatus Falkowbacteria bacterium CG10_big_fil_rev_8_21_14_0_10_39_11]|uniref:SbsA Ig-like domain-containing protein n=1 Tax=Candidatus Falkowbacteria bacterium CG10_big_fil_rev_8_21_14_0_10_39_11 TaxID=1974565 RepID=A0A2H0V7E3_9BACT|nr:MAG: hypothetical protein COT97_02090 [Candidatus Falkowbacteria bacterium CG10_big_fil_rev_8_21_14_0_10_39_11]